MWFVAVVVNTSSANKFRRKKQYKRRQTSGCTVQLPRANHHTNIAQQLSWAPVESSQSVLYTQVTGILCWWQCPKSKGAVSGEGRERRRRRGLGGWVGGRGLLRGFLAWHRERDCRGGFGKQGRRRGAGGSTLTCQALDCSEQAVALSLHGL